MGLRRLVSLALLVLAPSLAADWHSQQQDIMGTRISINFWLEDGDKAKAAMEAALAEMRRVDEEYSPFKGSSQLSRLNRLAPLASAEQPLAISPELNLLLDRSLHYGRLTQGAFDITFASLGRYYDYRKGKAPDAATRKENLPAINYQWVRLDAEKHQVYFAHPKVYVDLGGIAKGYAVDRVIDLLQRDYGVTQASVSAGGDSRVLGNKQGRPWLVGIKNPRDQKAIAITLPLEDTAISTSGDYERYFVDDQGQRVHHILNPRTGESAQGIASVTILGPHTFDTDALSTSVFVLGVAKGLALIDSLPGFDAIIITSSGQVHYSQGLTPP
jgi:thiamine biosynthesis lipoprotein